MNKKNSLLIVAVVSLLIIATVFITLKLSSNKTSETPSLKAKVTKLPVKTSPTKKMPVSSQASILDQKKSIQEAIKQKMISSMTDCFGKSFSLNIKGKITKESFKNALASNNANKVKEIEEVFHWKNIHLTEKNGNEILFKIVNEENGEGRVRKVLRKFSIGGSGVWEEREIGNKYKFNPSDSAITELSKGLELSYSDNVNSLHKGNLSLTIFQNDDGVFRIDSQLASKQFKCNRDQLNLDKKFNCFCR